MSIKRCHTITQNIIFVMIIIYYYSALSLGNVKKDRLYEGPF